MQKTTYITYKCTPTNLLCTLRFWKPHKVLYANIIYFRSSHRRCSLRKSVLRNFAKFTGKQLCQSLKILKICRKFTEKHPRRSAISINVQSTLRHGCSPVNFLHIFRIPFLKNTSGRLLLYLLTYNDSETRKTRARSCFYQLH